MEGPFLLLENMPYYGRMKKKGNLQSDKHMKKIYQDIFGLA